MVERVEKEREEAELQMRLKQIAGGKPDGPNFGHLTDLSAAGADADNRAFHNESGDDGLVELFYPGGPEKGNSVSPDGKYLNKRVNP